MPLTGSISDRIRELTHHGKKPRSHDQIVAIAVHSYHDDGGGKKKKTKLQMLFEKHGIGKKKESKKAVNEPMRLSLGSIKEAINRAAERVHLTPTEKQRKAGNYRMGHVKIQGLDITLENPAGSIRKGKGWETTMKHHYGYIKRTESEADGDHIDVFVGDHPESEIVFVIDQDINGRFDEHKCMIGFTNAEEAEKAYHDNYSKGWKGFRGIRALTMDQFKQWITRGHTHIPIAKQVLTFNSAPIKLSITEDAIEPDTVDSAPTQPRPRPLPDWVPRENPKAKNPENSGWISTAALSSWINGLKFTRENGVQMRTRRGGKVYSYPGFGLSEFRRWVAAKSPGGWWWRNIGYPMKDFEPNQLSRFTGIIHPLFGPGIDSPVRWFRGGVSYSPNEFMDWIHRHVNPNMTDTHLSALLGWIPGSSTTAEHDGPIGYRHQVNGTEPTTLSFMTSAPGYNNSRTFYSKNISPLGVPELHNDYLNIDKEVPKYGEGGLRVGWERNPYRGISGPILLRQMRAAHEMGIPKISWLAAWTPDQNEKDAFSGGLHWPLLGANGIVPYSSLRIPPYIWNDVHRTSNGRFAQTGLFSDFFTSPMAKKWYEENPETHSSFVDTAPGSYSRREVERHVSENAAKHGFAGPTEDTAVYSNPEHERPIRMNMFQNYVVPWHLEHPAINHLITTGSLHPEYFDEYFNK